MVINTEQAKNISSPNLVDFHEDLLIFIFISSVYPFLSLFFFFFLLFFAFFNLIYNVSVSSHKQEGVALNIPASRFYLDLLNS